MTKITLYNKDGKKYVRIGKKKLHIPLEITNKYELIRWIIEYLTRKRRRAKRKPKTKVNPTTGHIDSLIKERLRLEEIEQKKRDKFIEEKPPPPEPPKQKKPKKIFNNLRKLIKNRNKNQNFVELDLVKYLLN